MNHFEDTILIDRVSCFFIQFGVEIKVKSAKVCFILNKINCRVF